MGTTAFGSVTSPTSPRSCRCVVSGPSLVDDRGRAPSAALGGDAPVMAWHARRDGVAPVVATYSALLTSMVIAATRLDRARPRPAAG